MNAKLLQRISLWCSTLCLLLSGVSAQAVTPGSYMAYYTSAIDSSTQNYGIYIPNSYNNFQLHPVIFIGHGFGGHATNSFNSTQTTFAETNGWLLVQLEGRGNNFYDGVGEVDFIDVLAQLRTAYTLDENHLYFEGESMGATGAYRQGLRHPEFLAAVGGVDGFADYRSWYTQYYGPAANPSYVEPFRLPNLEMSSCVDVAENAKWQRLWMQVHDGDTSVLPANTLNLNAQLTALETPEGDYVHEMHEGPGGHVSSYDQLGLYNYFLTKSLNRYPLHVVCKTTQLKYGRMHWVGIDRIRTTNGFATVDAKIEAPTGGVTAVTVTTSNVLQYTLYLNGNLVDPTQSYTIVTDGASSPVYAGPAGTITMYATLDSMGNITSWTTVNPFPNVLHKTAAIEGPIGHAYTSSFVVVYGSDAADKSEADNFCSQWNSHMEAAITSRADSTITTADVAASNLILFGTANSNSVLSHVQPSLPIQVDSTGVTVGSKRYSGTNYGAYFVYPNPANTSKYIVISHKIVPGSQVKDLEALPWYWPDYVVFDTNLSAGPCIQSSLNYLPSTFVDAGYFDAYWNLLPTPSAPPAPTYLLAAGGNGTASLSWAASSGAVSYNVLRSTTNGAGYTTVTNGTGVTTTSFSDSGLAAGVTYYYVVQAVNAGGTSANSNQATVTFAPAAPTLSATAGNGTVSLIWTAPSGATSYALLRSTTSGSGYVAVTNASNLTSTSFTDTGLSNGTTYYYVVRASNSGGTSPNSNQASATPTLGLMITSGPAASASRTSAKITWTTNLTASGVVHYGTTMSLGKTVTGSSGVKSHAVTLGSLTRHTTYYYSVQSTTGGSTVTSTIKSFTTN